MAPEGERGHDVAGGEPLSIVLRVGNKMQRRIERVLGIERAVAHEVDEIVVARQFVQHRRLVAVRSGQQSHAVAEQLPERVDLAGGLGQVFSLVPNHQQSAQLLRKGLLAEIDPSASDGR